MSRSGRMLRLAIIGVIGGFFSGLFGVGGGIIIVPLLVLLLHYEQRLAAGTSLTAILPTAVAGTIAYGLQGSVDWIAGLCLGAGAIVGSLIGTWILHRTRQIVLRWLFIAFLVIVAVRMFFFIPERGAELDLNPGLIAALVGVGLITGILSGLLGVGGGVIVVPVLMLGFGASDLIAKGTSLLMMIPTSITGTISNMRRRNSDVRGALVIGCLAIPASFGGAALAALLPPLLGSILFALLLLYSAGQLAWNALRPKR